MFICVCVDRQQHWNKEIELRNISVKLQISKPGYKDNYDVKIRF